MNKNIRDGLCAVLMLVCAYGILVAGVYFSQFKDKPAIGDLATWVGALFAGLAFLGTIYLATRDRAKINADALVIAQIFALSINGRASVASRDLKRLVADLDSEITYFGVSSFTDAEKVLKRHDQIWTEDEIAKIVPLDRNCAYDMAQAKSSMQIAAALCNEAGDNSGYDQSKLEYTKELAVLLQHASRRLDNVFSFLNAEAKNHFTLNG